jgi:hypothetical protein
MTHRPSVPAGSTAPYPAHPAPHGAKIQSDAPSPELSGNQRTEKIAALTKILGAAVGIGSAAIVAALLYARQRRA